MVERERAGSRVPDRSLDEAGLVRKLPLIASGLKVRGGKTLGGERIRRDCEDARLSEDDRSMLKQRKVAEEERFSHD
jgi:hypothetical protein